MSMRPPISPNGAPTSNIDTQRGQEAHLEFAELSEELQRTMVVTRRLIIGVGGTGVNAVIAIGFGMNEHGMKFGKVDRFGREVVDAFVLDSNLDDTFDSSKSDDAQALKEMGVNGSHLYVPEQDKELRRAGIKDKLTPGFPAKEDAAGCNAQPRVGHARYGYLREAGTDQNNGMYMNPVEGLKSIVKGWKDPGKPRFDKNRLHLDVIGGLSGGTGPSAPAVLADTLEMMKNVLGRDINVTTTLYMMSGESMGNIEDGMQDQRDINSAVQMMYLNEQTHRGGVSHASGKFTPGIPEKLYVLDGQSPNTIHKGYGPAKVAAKNLMAEIAGEGSHAGAMSNIKHSTVGGEVPTPDNSGTAVLRPLRRFSALGSCETLPKVPAVILEREKRKYLFAAAAGLNALTDEQKERTDTARETVLPTAFLQALLANVEAPGIKYDDIFNENAINATKDNADQQVRNFTGSKLNQLRTKLTERITKVRESVLKQLAAQSAKILAEEGIAAQAMFIQKLRATLGFIVKECAEQKALLNQSIADDMKTLPAYKQAVEQKQSNLPLIFGRGDAINALKKSVEDLVSHVNQIGNSARNFRAFEILAQEFFPQLTAELDTAFQANKKFQQQASAVFGDIKEAFPADKTSKTAYDITMDVQQNWKEDPKALRDSLGGFSLAEMQKLVRSIKLTLDDIDLMQKMTKGTTEAVAEWATPLFRQSEYYDKRAVRGTPRIFTLPTTSIETDDKGQVTGTKNIHIPRGFQVVPVSTSGRIMATTETHGISPLERQYFIEGLEKILNLSPEERSKYFTQIGDAERLLPEFAKALAEAKLDQAGSGSIESCGGCNLSFYTEQKMSKEAPKAEKTEGEEANDVEPKPEPYCCTGCKKAGGNGKK